MTVAFYGREREARLLRCRRVALLVGLLLALCRALLALELDPGAAACGSFDFLAPAADAADPRHHHVLADRHVRDVGLPVLVGAGRRGRLGALTLARLVPLAG